MSGPKNDRSVLIVEDDADLREMMCLLLALEGFKPVAARDGVEALERSRSHQVEPGVIVLDLMMPRMNGEQFIKELAPDPSLHAIPVVVLTAAPSERVERTAAVLENRLTTTLCLTRFAHTPRGAVPDRRAIGTLDCPRIARRISIRRLDN